MVGLHSQEAIASPVTVPFAYNRKQAFEDGVLVNASGIAKQLGFRIPLALTEAAWRNCVSWERADNKRKGIVDNEETRLYAVVLAAARAKDNARVRRFPGNELVFSVFRVPRPGLRRDVQEVDLVLSLDVEGGRIVGTISLASEA